MSDQKPMTMTEFVKSCDEPEILACIALKYFGARKLFGNSKWTERERRIMAASDELFRAVEIDHPEFPRHTNEEDIERHIRELREDAKKHGLL